MKPFNALMIVILIAILYVLLRIHFTLEYRVETAIANYFEESSKTEIINLYE